jgi:hypothetical protein
MIDFVVDEFGPEQPFPIELGAMPPCPTPKANLHSHKRLGQVTLRFATRIMGSRSFDSQSLANPRIIHR